ncbi:MAG: AIR synthase family protein [Thermodesulfobacteriota bacterium]
MKINKGDKKKFDFYPAGKLPIPDLAKLLSRYTHKDDRLIVRPGIGKDATVISFGERYLVAKTDPITFATDQIGWYAVHVNANDIAVMGGIPRWFLATLLLPAGKTNQEKVEEILVQIDRACREIGVALCGGHTEITYGLDRPLVIGHMLGEIDKGKLVVPEKICPGDKIILTKGLAIEGTALIAREKRELAEVWGEEFVKRCQQFLTSPGISILPEARLAQEVATIHAMHDPTEGGLATGVHELAMAAQVGMIIEMEKIFIWPETAILCRNLKLDPLGLLASGALLIVAPDPEASQVVSALRKGNIPAEIIGTITGKDGGVKVKKGEELADLPFFPRDEVARLFAGEEV